MAPHRPARPDRKVRSLDGELARRSLLSTSRVRETCSIEERSFLFRSRLERLAAAERPDVVILLAVLILIATVWQATGLATAKVHMVVNGINLDRGEYAHR
jgi:hypothetical protein